MKKLINDPIHGFVSVQNELLLALVDHPIFQRLRRIRQGGLIDLVYPGAVHTRFHHALGAMHLMDLVLQTLRKKNVDISEKEHQAALIAILLHDLGHSPLSHSLEGDILAVDHEDLSVELMRVLNQEFGGQLNLALQIFEGKYERPFFYELVSGQIDTDRMDYILRDSYYSGVSEGTIDTNRLINMMNVRNNELVLDEKSLYSIEHFLNARRLMYWQVYLHKTHVCLKNMLKMTILRAKYLLRQGENLPLTDNLAFFLRQDLHPTQQNTQNWLEPFIALDDYDVWTSLKNMQHCQDKYLRFLSKSMLQRQLFSLESSFQKFEQSHQDQVRQRIKKDFGEDQFLFRADQMRFSGYEKGKQSIRILQKNGQIVRLEDTTNWTDMDALTKIVEKYYLCYPKNVYLQNF